MEEGGREGEERGVAAMAVPRVADWEVVAMEEAQMAVVALEAEEVAEAAQEAVATAEALWVSAVTVKAHTALEAMTAEVVGAAAMR